MGKDALNGTKNLNINRGDRVRITVNGRPITGVADSVFFDPIDGSYGIEFTSEDGAGYWKQWSDGGTVELLVDHQQELGQAFVRLMSGTAGPNDWYTKGGTLLRWGTVSDDGQPIETYILSSDLPVSITPPSERSHPDED